MASSSVADDDGAPKPRCPFCGSADLRVVEVTNDFRALKVECRRCGSVSMLGYPPIGR